MVEQQDRCAYYSTILQYSEPVRPSEPSFPATWGENFLKNSGFRLFQRLIPSTITGDSDNVP